VFWEVQTRKITVEGQQEKKFYETHLNKYTWYTAVIPARWEA
jgi:hypothetical protein